MKVLVGSENPVKIESVRESFSEYFDNVEVEGIKVDSDVSDQPMDEQETREGAKNRAERLKEINEERSLGADFFVGIEGGIRKGYSRYLAFGFMYILDKNNDVGEGISPTFELPEIMIEKIHEGKEMGDAIDEIMNENNSKQKGGTIEFFTKGVMDRKELYRHGIIMALVPFVSKNLFKQSSNNQS